MSIRLAVHLLSMERMREKHHLLPTISPWTTTVIELHARKVLMADGRVLQSGVPQLSCRLSKAGPRSVGMKSSPKQGVSCLRRKRRTVDEVVPAQAPKELILMSRMPSSSCLTMTS